MTKTGPRCPRCGRRTANRCPRAGALERVLSAVYVYPFRCQICTRRFRALQLGTRYTRQIVDRREYERASVRIPVTFTTRGEQAEGELRDLALGGCGLETEFPLRPGDTLRIELNLPRQTAPIVIEAATARSASEGRVGVHFDRMTREDRKRLHGVMLGLLGYAPHTSPGGSARRGPSLRSRLTGNVMLATILVVILALSVALLFPLMSFCVWGVNC
jgi:hypothetical protein